MRNHFASYVFQKMQTNPDLVLLYGDIGNRLFLPHKSAFPKRVINAGIAEPLLVSLAAGLANAGYIPICYTINSFLYSKAFEQIKLDVCYPARPVIFVGTGGGLSYSSLGTTHHSLEDMGAIGLLPGIEFLIPSGPTELEFSLDFAVGAEKPVYLRLGKKGEQDFGPFESDRNGALWRIASLGPSPEVAVISVGAIGANVFQALSSRVELANRTAHFSLWGLSALESEDLLSPLSQFGKILVVEEHYERGGVFAEILRVKAALNREVEIRRVGPPSQFFSGDMNRESRLASFGLGPDSLATEIEALIGQ